MSLPWIILIVLALAAAGFLLGRGRALSSPDSRMLHSLPAFHGWFVALSTAVPALLWLLVGLLALPLLAAGDGARGQGFTVVVVITVLLSLAGLALSLKRVSPDFRARNVVERFSLLMLILASTIAILTTLGIVLSMLFETMNFFSQYPWQDFFFSLTWAPAFHGQSQLGILPLLWGTLYISFIALAVAVPIGLFAAIYMSEYASKPFRSVAKPLIEILAGIPTIVYGLFALITVGPLLRDWIAQPTGLGTSGSSVMTAGLVMGVMLIPFVSSLSDDIMNAVPQSLRDGSFGLGATKSETIRQVVLPAALPGIVGAVLLATSRAIGETMIVVLGAGAAAQMSLNPFEAMTTVTVKIVSQLTGDTDFASPETLVAFALGLTLFVMTLGLNVLALHIVRKYREQYE
ncbi:phosphate ABC transporter permease subunit PstC [Haematobacter genomosp. 1]|uniref:Phosphate transport system permease protein n=1 Tax=Haematobacter genomosp. 1 TaxID=366618 RepID=A0A212ACD2_9RHOB|nr:phosphate ABC transporter permease subunit PstC [Haematobacter genomosp. 1]OWJ78533.1 phosphate ABC transporter permease subunit PstC [Haematobacter genomosp. 1]